jgi:hypothetical protein
VTASAEECAPGVLAAEPRVSQARQEAGGRVTDGKATSTVAAISGPAKTGCGRRPDFRAGAGPSSRPRPSQAAVELAVLVAATEAEPGRDAVMLFSSLWP